MRIFNLQFTYGITGMEIQDGLLRFVKWFATVGHEYQYTLLAPPRQIRELIRTYAQPGG